MPSRKPPRLSPQAIKALKLATLGGNDADLFLLDEIVAFQDKSRGEKGDKGEAGDDGKDGKSIVGPTGPAGKDGKDGLDGRDGVDGLPGTHGKDGSPDTPEQVLAKVNSATTLIKRERVEGLDDEIKRIEGKIPQRTISGPNANAVQYADLTSQCNGVLKTFYVPNHRKALMLIGTQFPILYRPDVDYTTGNKSLTMTSEVSAPQTGQSLVFLYIK